MVAGTSLFWYNKRGLRVAFTTDGCTNIVLGKGSYWVILDPVAERITIESAK